MAAGRIRTTATTSMAVAPDGTNLLTRHWPADGAPWASVLIIHGLAEHSGRYEDVGRQMAEAGLEVHAARPLFRPLRPPASVGRTEYAVTADGRRFLFNIVVPDASPRAVTMLLNWKIGAK